MPVHEKHRDQIERLRRIATAMDSSFGVPGTRVRFGLDPLLGLVPGVGDLAGAAVASLIVFEARRMGVPRRVYARMMANVLIDFLVGSVPIAGDALDFWFKPSKKNIALLEAELENASG